MKPTNTTPAASASRHTPGELIVAEYSRGTYLMILGKTDKEIAFIDTQRNTPGQSQIDAKHLAACWNALAGMNPEAVKDVVDALKEALESMDTHDDIQKSFFQAERKQARAALAKLKAP